MERNPTPLGVNIVNLKKISKHQSGDIISLATQIQNADEAIKNNASTKLTLILEQIQFLQSQAKKILEESEEQTGLHHVACNFKKITGQIYHLYEKESGQKYFSMLSPADWGNSSSQRFLGSFRLEADLSWTPADKIVEINKSRNWAQSLMDAAKKNRVLAIEQITDTEMME